MTIEKGKRAMEKNEQETKNEPRESLCKSFFKKTFEVVKSL